MLLLLLARWSAAAIWSGVDRKTSTYREPIVCLSRLMADSARSSAPNSTNASPLGRPLGPSTMCMPA